jgi:hypothetical protein
MSNSIAISLLRQGNTGNEILQILDALIDDSNDDAVPVSVTSEPTLESIQF